MNRILSALLAFSVLFAGVACSSSPSDPGDPGTDDKNSFTVNGNGYSESKFKGYSSDSTGGAGEANGAGAISIGGVTDRSGESFILTLLTKSNAPGSYQVDASEGNAMTLIVRNGSTTTTYFAGSGSITIEEWGSVGGTASGKFDGSFVDLTDPQNTVIQVTAGRFSVEIFD